MERWLPVIGYESNYIVSSFGQVYSRPRHGTKGGILPSHIDRGGYMWVKLCKNGKCDFRYVHTLVLAAFIGSRPLGKETRHLDGNQKNNNLLNLTYGTHEENLQDRAKHNRFKLNHIYKTICSKGHPYDADNTGKWRDKRYCRACKYSAIYSRYYRRRNATFFYPLLKNSSRLLALLQ